MLWPDGVAPRGRMGDLDALFWSLEAGDPRFRSDMTLVATFERPVGLEEMHARLESLTRVAPRLRERVVAGQLPMAPPRWEPAPSFDVSRHLRSVPAPAGDLFEYVGGLVGEPLDRSRPPWEVVLVGGEALVARLHHSYTDGMGALLLAAGLFEPEPRPTPAAPAGTTPEPVPQATPQPTGTRGLWDDLTFEAARSGRLLARLGSWAAGTVAAARLDPGPITARAEELLSSALLLARSSLRPGSDLIAGRSGLSRLGTLELPLGSFKRVARRAGGTVNDVFLAGVLGGMRIYHGKHGSGAPALRIGVPVSTRLPNPGPVMGNHLEGFMLRGPLRLADPLERIRLMHELVLGARRQPALALAVPAIGAALRLPGARGALARMVGFVDVIASNLAGSPVPLYLGGARVERLVPFGPRGGAGLNLTLLSYCDEVAIGVHADPASIEDHEVLLDCLGAGFEETLSVS